jgi:hypothetical protein
MKTGDLANIWGGPKCVILLERDQQADTGEWWWRVHCADTNRRKIIGEWHLEVINESR